MIIWLASYPRSGNTFFRVLLNSVFGVKTYSIYDDKRDIGADKVLSDVVGHTFLPKDFSLKQTRETSELYFIKTHDYPDKADGDKVIYLLRDGRECTLSYCRYLNDYANKPQSILGVIHGEALFGCWGEHVKAWAPEDSDDTMLVQFEELIREPLALVPRIEAFTGIKAVSNELPSFDELHRKGPKFFRSGKTDSWKSEYSELEHQAFWLRNHAEMVKYGYTDEMPRVIAEAARVPGMFEILSSQNAYLDRHYSSKLQQMEQRVRQLEQRLPVREETHTVVCEQSSDSGNRAGADGQRLTPSPDTRLPEQGEPTSEVPRAGVSGHSETPTGPDVRATAIRLSEAGESSFKQGDLDGAEQKFLDAMQYDPGFADGYNNLVVLYWHRNEPGPALRFLKAGLRLAPDHPELLINGAEILKALGKTTEADSLGRQRESGAAVDPQVISTLRQLEVESGDAGESGNSGSRVGVSRVVASLVEKGEKLFRDGSFAAAESCFICAHDLNSENVHVLNNLAVLYWQENEFEKAVDFLLQAMNRDSTNRDVVINAAHMFAVLGEREKASKVCGQYLVANPDDQEVRSLFDALCSDGETYAKVGQAKKFAIFTAAGSGSTLLVQLLNSHPDIACQFELFEPSKIVSSKPSDPLLNDKKFRDKDPVAYIDRLSEYYGDREAVGFKLFPHHMKDVIEHVLRDTHTLKIVLDRENRLLSYSSRLVAQKTDQWGLWGDKTPKKAKVVFDQQEFSEYCEELDVWYAYIDDVLEETGQKALYIDYVDLLNEWKQKEILDYLSVRKDVVLTAGAKKQNADTYAQRFENPEAVEQALTQAGCERWLGDQAVAAGDSSTNAAADCGGEPASNDEVRGLIARGESLFANGNVTGAIALFEQALQQDAGNPEARNNLLVAYWESGALEKSIKCLADALEDIPQNKSIVSNGGQILTALGNVEEARALYVSFLRSHPGDTDVISLLSSLEEQEGEQLAPGRTSSSEKETRKQSSSEVERIDFSEPGHGSVAPRISVVIPSFNQGAYLETTIRSVLDQGYPNLELIVMDGGSTDRSVEIIRKYQDKITYWQSQPDEGQYWAINEGFKRCSGEIMTWINSDDKLHPNSLHTMASIFAQCSDVEWVTGTPSVMDEEGLITWICHPTPVFKQENYLRKKYDAPTFIQQEGTFWRRSLWERAGARLQTDLQMAGDLELWARFFRYAPLYTADVCTGCFRQQRNQKTALAMDLYREEADRVLDKEVALFKKEGRLISPVEPLRIAAPAGVTRRYPRLDKEISGLFNRDECQLATASSLPHEAKGKGARSAMHGKPAEPLVSAIVSTYNSAEYIRGCLEALQAQTIAHKLDIVVIDSNSQQDEACIVKEFSERYDNIRYLRTDARETVYAAWNRGIELARGKYVINANTDDRFAPDALERLADSLEKHPDTAAAYGNWWVTRTPNDSFSSDSDKFLFVYPDFTPPSLLYYQVTSHALMVRRSIFDHIGRYDGEYQVFGDREFALRLAQRGLKAMNTGANVGLYLENPSSIEHRTRSGRKEFDRLRDLYTCGDAIKYLFGFNGDLDVSALADLFVVAAAAGRDLYEWWGEPVSDYPFAARLLARALELQPGHPAAQHNLALISLAEGDLKTAKRTLEQCAQRVPAHWKEQVLRNRKLLKGKNTNVRDYEWLIPDVDAIQAAPQVQGAVWGTDVEPGSDPLVSVIVATKDRPEMLKHALRSLEQQTYRHWEAIVINDGGTDVAELVEQFDSSGRMRHLQNLESQGQAKARNRALRHASGDIICVLDDDDLFLPHHLDTVVSELTNSSRMFIYTDAYVVQEVLGRGERREVSRSQPYEHGKYSKERLHVDNYIPINTWAFRKACVEAVGYFDEAMTCCEDWEYLLRLAQEYEFTHIPLTTVEVHHRVDVIDNVTRQRLDETVSAYERIYAKYAGPAGEGLVQARAQAIAGLHEKARRLEERRRSKAVTESGELEDSANPAKVDALELQRQQFLSRAESRAYHLPPVHLITVMDRAEPVQLARTLESLGQQLYAGWGLTVISQEEAPASEFSEMPMLEWVQTSDAQQALTEAIDRSPGEWVGLLEPGDALSPVALSRCVDYLNMHPEWQFVYSDEDRISGDGERPEVLYKPDVNPDYLRSFPYIGGFALFRKASIDGVAVTGGRSAVVNYDVCLNLLDRFGENSVGHIAEVLYHCHVTEESDADRRAVHECNRRALQSHLNRKGVEARVGDGLVPATFMLDYTLKQRAHVCVVIYGSGEADRVEHTVTSVLQKTGYSNFTVRVAAAEPLATRLGGLGDERLLVDEMVAVGSRADYCQRVAQESGADYLVFLNPGTVPIQEPWLECMLAQGQQDGIGAVGVRLVAHDSRVVHAGILTGVGAFGVGALAFDGNRLDEAGYMQRAQVAQDLSAVSSACMLIDAGLFQDVGGFDPLLDVQFYQDLDLCQKLTERDRKVVWTPSVTMLYLGEKLDSYGGEEGLDRVERDAECVTSRWLHRLARDPAYNRNLSLKRPDFTVDEEFAPQWDPNIDELPRVVGFGAGSYGSWQYRVVQPLDVLDSANRIRRFNTPLAARKRVLLPSPVELERVQADTLLMHNTLHDDHIQRLAQYKSINGAFVVFGQDDIMFDLPPTNPFAKTGYKDIKRRLRKCLGLADRLVVTTQPLADALRNMANDIVVLPNYLDETLWGALQSQRAVSAKPRVGWAGAQQHGGDLQLLSEVVRATASEVDWVFFGMCPEAIRPLVKEVHDVVLFEEYPEKLASLNLDLAVAPLERHKFNAAKSNLRILEYGILGWSVIATDIEPYRDAPVCRVPNQPRAWINAIRERIHDLDAAWQEGDALRAWVRANWMLQQHQDAWLEVLRPASGISTDRQMNSRAAGL